MRTALFLPVLLSVTALSGCSKLIDKLTGAKPKPTIVAVAPPPPAPVVPAVATPQFATPFEGTYNRTAKVSYKGGRRIQVSNMKGTASLAITPGRIVFDQTYPGSDVPEARVTQTYTFAEGDMKPVSGGGFDVALVFEKMDSNTKNYSADDRNPKIQARRLGKGWQIGLLIADANGVSGGSEFQ